MLIRIEFKPKVYNNKNEKVELSISEIKIVDKISGFIENFNHFNSCYHFHYENFNNEIAWQYVDYDKTILKENGADLYENFEFIKQSEEWKIFQRKFKLNYILKIEKNDF